MGNQPQTNLSSRLIKLLHKYYECQEEVERPVGASQDRVGDSEISKNLSKQKIDEIYTREKRELEQSRRSLTDAENIEFEEKKERIEKERDAELIKDDSFDAEQKKFEATIESVTDKLDKELNTKLAELKTAYLQQVADFSAVQQRRIDTLKEDKRRIIQQKKEVEEKNRIATEEFLEKTKSEIDSVLDLDCDYTIGEVKDFSDVNTLP